MSGDHDLKTVEALESQASRLSEAGDHAAAAEPLLRAAQIAANQADQSRCAQLVNRYEAALDASGVQPVCPARVEALILRTLLYVVHGDLEGARKLGVKAETEAARLQMIGPMGRLVRIRGIVNRLEGKLEAANAALEAATDLLLAGNEFVEAGKAALGRVHIYRNQSDPEGARACVEIALTHFRAVADDFWVHTALTVRGRCDELSAEADSRDGCWW